MEVKGMIANPPRNVAILAARGRLVRLALDARVHDVVSAYGAVVHDHIPRPQGDRVILFDFEAWFILGRRDHNTFTVAMAVVVVVRCRVRVYLHAR